MSKPDLFIPFTSDYGFKVTFGNESNTLFLRRALQALIQSSIPISKVTFDKTIFEGITKDSRSGIFDIACIDEAGNHFIVEMQLSEFLHFMQRLKFYGFQKFNSMVRKGIDYHYDNLTKIYSIAILSKSISSLENYHNIGCIKNQTGEVMDEQMLFVTVELDKFNKKEIDCKTDLEKLIFTMKMVNKIKEPTKYPQFWTEEWLKIAMDELDTRKLTPEEYTAYVMTLDNNAIAIQLTKQREEAFKKATIEKVTNEVTQKVTNEVTQKVTNEVTQKVTNEVTQNLIKRAMLRGLSDREITDFFEVPLNDVQIMRAEIPKN